jgi:hypothetical protein
VKRASVSILRDEELCDVLDVETELSSEVEMMSADTAANNPKRNPHNMEQELKTELQIHHRWL